MNTTPHLRVVPAPPGTSAGPPGRFGPDACYAAAVWLPILGPAPFTMWSLLAHRLGRFPGGVTTSVEVLAAECGLDAPGRPSPAVARAMCRLECFGVLRRVNPELIIVRVRLPFASAAQLDRLHPSIRRRHDVIHDRMVNSGPADARRRRGDTRAEPSTNRQLRAG